MKNQIKYKLRRLVFMYVPFMGIWTSTITYGIWNYCCRQEEESK